MDLDIDFERRFSGGIEPITFLNNFDAQKLISRHKCSPESENYEREVLFENEKYELVFCHWKSGDMSEMHDHEGKQCWFRCLEGILTENKENIHAPKLLKENSISYIDDNLGEHQILNKMSDCAFSLHLYIRES